MTSDKLTNYTQDDAILQLCERFGESLEGISTTNKYTILMLIAALNGTMLDPEYDYSDEPYQCQNAHEDHAIWFTVQTPDEEQDFIWHILDILPIEDRLKVAQFLTIDLAA